MNIANINAYVISVVVSGSNLHSYMDGHRQVKKVGWTLNRAGIGVASYGALGHVPPWAFNNVIIFT